MDSIRMHEMPRKTTPPSPPRHAKPSSSSSTTRHSRSSSSPTSPPRPLDQIRAQEKAAHRAPHLRKANQTRPDQIDALDNVGIVGGIYHHDGPFDAALASRNRDERVAPLAAVRDSNREALKATPAVHVVDSLKRHVPLQGVAVLPPGEADYSQDGRVMSYQEGADLQREERTLGGPYRRYEGVKYHPDDLKGKGEPSFTIERALKEGKKTKDD